VNAILDRGRSIAARIAGLPPVVTFNEVMATYNSAAGGLLAAGLAYGALVALLPGFLLFIGLVGFVIRDPETRSEIIRQASAQIPPLAELVRDGVTSLVDTASAASILGLVGLAWGTSRFYGSLDEAFARIFRLAPERSMVERLVRGFLSVVLLLGAFVGALVATGAQQFVDGTLPGGPAGDALRTILRLGVPIAAAVVVTLIVAAIYKMVPNVKVPMSALLPPAIVVGILLALLTQLFVFIAPRLVGSLAVFGGFAAVFAALAWLALGFQALLIGAAWVRERVHDADPSSVPPTPAEGGVDPVVTEPQWVRREPLPPPPPGVQPAPRPELREDE
jgi:YihY family inner membrane protein